LLLLPERSPKRRVGIKLPAGASLLLRARPKEDESDLGFLVRLAELNSYETPRWIVNAANLNPIILEGHWSTISKHDVNLVRLAQLTRLQVRDLASLFYRPADDNSVTAFGHPVSSNLLRRRSPKVCPQCLRESNYCRKQWDFSAVTSCPVHRMMLLEDCHVCGKRLQWSRARVSLCPCGADWREKHMARLNKSETVVSQLIYERLGLWSSKPHNSTENPLFNWDLNSSINALSQIANQQDSRPNKGSWKPLKGKSRDIHERLLQAFSVFEYWPRNFHNFIDQHQSMNKRTGVVANLGSLYQRLRRLPQFTLVAQVLGKEFENYMLGRWDRGYLKKIRCIGTDGKYIPLVKASRILHMHYHLLERLVSEGKVKAVIRKTGRTRLFLIEAADVEKLRLERDKSLSLQPAARLLGVSQLDLLRLVEHHLIVPTKSPMTGSKGWEFDKDNLQSFLTKLFSKVNRSKSTQIELRTFGTVLSVVNTKLSSSGDGIQILLNDILQGTLVPRRRFANRIGIPGLSFSRQEVKAYLERKLRLKTNTHLQPTGDLAIHGLSPPLVQFLVDKGLIKINKVRGTNKGSATITNDAILLFKSQFIFAKEAARSVRTSVSFLIDALQKVDVTPVSGRNIDFGPQYIFRRADLARINLGKLIKRSPRQRVKKVSNLISLAEAAEILSVPEESVIELVKNDVLKPSSFSVQSKHPLFNRLQVERYQGRFENLVELISTRAAAAFLKITRSKLYHSWIRSGYLTCEVFREGRSQFLRKPELENVSAFMNTVVTSKQAARLLGVPYTYIYRWRIKKLLRPVNNPYPSALWGFIYSKADMANLRVSQSPICSQYRILLKVDPPS